MDGDGICDDEDACLPNIAEMTAKTTSLTVESYNVGALGTTYRFYVNASDATDKMSAVFGNDQNPLVINTPDDIYNDAFNTSWNASGINAALFGFFPDLEYDSYATIGLEGPAAGVAGAGRSFLGAGCLLTQCERLLPIWRFWLEREHPHWRIMVRPEHRCQRPPY